MTDFDCTAFARWLDDGGTDPALLARAEAHAAGCGRCGEALAGERAVRVLFAAQDGLRHAGVPSEFADGVMARIALTPQDARLPAAVPAFEIPSGAVFPWWIRAAAQPASVLALLLAGVATLFTPQLLGASRGAPQWSAAALAFVTGALSPWLGRANAIVGSDPWAGAGVALAFLPLVAIASLGFYRLGTSITTARFAVPRAVPAGGRRA